VISRFTELLWCLYSVTEKITHFLVLGIRTCYSTVPPAQAARRYSFPVASWSKAGGACQTGARNLRMYIITNPTHTHTSTYKIRHYTHTRTVQSLLQCLQCKKYFMNCHWEFIQILLSYLFFKRVGPTREATRSMSTRVIN